MNENLSVPGERYDGLRAAAAVVSADVVADAPTSLPGAAFGTLNDTVATALVLLLEVVAGTVCGPEVPPPPPPPHAERETSAKSASTDLYCI